MLITLIAGARPNFMKIASLIKAIQKAHSEGKDIHYRLVHTGQHYDKNMSDTFFEELGIPMPDINLGCGGGTQAEQTANIMVAFERDLMANPTDLVLVVGDVTSTMACSIVAKKLHTRVCHVEAGIRSWDLSMPEEINRMVTDSLADYMFTTSEVANKNLLLQGCELQAYPKSFPEGKDCYEPTHNPFLNQPILNPSLEGRTLNSGENSPFPLGEGRGEACFASVFGAHTADSMQYDLLKENAKNNRKNPTEAESVLWDMLKGNNIGYHFRRQHIILDYIVDFICLDKGLVIELDGGYHNNPEQKEYDAQRTAHLQRLGYTELRFKNEELLCDPVSVIAKITETLKTLPSLQGRVGDRLAEEMYTFPRTPQRVWWVGNVMIDTLLANRARFTKPAIYDELCLQEKNYVVMTMHRPANVDEEQHLKALMEQIITNVHGLPIIFPIHPRTAKIFYNLWGDKEQLRILFPNLHIVDPRGYLAFNYLVEHAKVVVTDSGGITEETTVMGVPCITLRDNTERPETCTIGTNRLIGTNPDAIKPALDALFAGQWQQGAIPPLWDGHTAERIVEILYSLKFKD